MKYFTVYRKVQACGRGGQFYVAPLTYLYLLNTYFKAGN